MVALLSGMVLVDIIYLRRDFFCTTLWLLCDPHGTDVFQKYDRLESVSTKYTLFLLNMGITL